MPRVPGQIITLDEVRQGDKISVIDGPHSGYVFRVIYPPRKSVKRELSLLVELHGGLVSGGGYYFGGPPEREVRLLDEFPTTNRHLISLKLDDDRAELFRNA
jgi:hypothetical protein